MIVVYDIDKLLELEKTITKFERDGDKIYEQHEEIERLKELNREMVEVLKHINELWNTRPQPGLRDKWDNAIETAGEVLAKAEGVKGNEN